MDPGQMTFPPAPEADPRNHRDALTSEGSDDA